jgi:hypothetical protein
MRAAESTHWYDARTGEPRYTVIGKNGKERPTTLRDAREHGYVPSVTAIIRQAAAPGLEFWKQKQVLYAALTLPRKPEETEEQFLARVMQDSQEQARKAAEKGTAIHAAIQGHFEGKPPDEEYWPYVKGAVQRLELEFGPQGWVCEQSFAHPMGFGGKVDMWGRYLVGDIKTKEFSNPSEKQLAWDEHAIQLAAYSVGLYNIGPLNEPPSSRAYHFNLFVSTTQPGLCHIHVWTDEEIQRGWRMFRSLLSYWQAKNGLETEAV